jgi:L-asparaginase II
MRNPVLIELTRGALGESVHAGAVAVVCADGEVVASVGDVASPIFPRSAIKPLQALPFVESGAVDRFGFGAPEIALACGSHAGAQPHVTGVAAMLAGAGLPAVALACGAHEPMDAATAREMIRSGASPTPLNHNCSGKHAAMLATSAHLDEPTEGYWRPEHPVQQRIQRTLEDMTGCALGADMRGIDGCSVPNWAMPLTGLARAFARLATGEGLAPGRADACRRIRQACWAHPELIAGQGQLVTLIMQRLPGQVLVKSGAEGVYCGAFPERGLGFALKIDDGAKRAAEAAVVPVISRFHPAVERQGPNSRLTNWRGVQVGEMRATGALQAMLDGLR